MIKNINIEYYVSFKICQLDMKMVMYHKYTNFDKHLQKCDIRVITEFCYNSLEYIIKIIYKNKLIFEHSCCDDLFPQYPIYYFKTIQSKGGKYYKVTSDSLIINYLRTRDINSKYKYCEMELDKILTGDKL